MGVFSCFTRSVALCRRGSLVRQGKSPRALVVAIRSDPVADRIPSVSLISERNLAERTCLAGRRQSCRASDVGLFRKVTS